MRTLFYDLRYALRQLGKAPGLALLAILTLALGSARTRPSSPSLKACCCGRFLTRIRSLDLHWAGSSDKTGFDSTSWMNYRDIRAQSKLLQDVAGYSEDPT